MDSGLAHDVADVHAGPAHEPPHHGLLQQMMAAAQMNGGATNLAMLRMLSQPKSSLSSRHCSRDDSHFSPWRACWAMSHCQGPCQLFVSQICAQSGAESLLHAGQNPQLSGSTKRAGQSQPERCRVRRGVSRRWELDSRHTLWPPQQFTKSRQAATNSPGPGQYCHLKAYGASSQCLQVSHCLPQCSMGW